MPVAKAVTDTIDHNTAIIQEALNQAWIAGYQKGRADEACKRGKE